MKQFILPVLCAGSLVIGLSGCTNTEVGTSLGAAAGAGIGYAIGGNTVGTLIGAGAGALVGHEIGKSQQPQQRYYRNGRYYYY